MSGQKENYVSTLSGVETTVAPFWCPDTTKSCCALPRRQSYLSLALPPQGQLLSGGAQPHCFKHLGTMMGLIKFIFVALCIQKNCIRGANLPSPASVSRCKEEKADYHSYASTAAILAERSAGVVTLLKDLPYAGGIFGVINIILKVTKNDKPDWEACIKNQITTMIKTDNPKKLLAVVNGQNRAKQTVLKALEDYKRHAGEVEDSWFQTEEEEKITERKQQEIWNTLKIEEAASSRSMDLFKTAGSELNAGYYFVLPYYADVHFEFLTLQIRLTKEFPGFTAEDTKKRKLNLGRAILFYSEVALKNWRKARDHWCKGEAISEVRSLKCECHCQPPPFKTYLEEWGKMAKSHGLSYAQKRITKWLKSNTIKTGDEVAFKAMKAITSSSWWYKYKDFSGYGDTGWLSCGGHSDYCYMRDCPGDYITDTTGCSGERFIIENEAGQSGVDIINKDRVLVNAEHGWHSDHTYYLNLYSPGTGSRPGHVVVLDKLLGPAWWNSAERGDDITQVNIITRFGNGIFGKGDRTALENADFVEIVSFDTTNQKKVMEMVFEIIKTKSWDGKSENGPITNMWKDEPVAPVMLI